MLRGPDLFQSIVEHFRTKSSVKFRDHRIRFFRDHRAPKPKFIVSYTLFALGKKGGTTARQVISSDLQSLLRERKLPFEVLPFPVYHEEREPVPRDLKPGFYLREELVSSLRPPSYRLLYVTDNETEIEGAHGDFVAASGPLPRGRQYIQDAEQAISLFRRASSAVILESNPKRGETLK